VVSGPAITAAAAGAGSCASTTPTSNIPPHWRRGTLLHTTDAPSSGERFEQILAHRNLVVEQILSGRNDDPETFVQDQDEWVLVVAGGAELAVNGVRLGLAPGDWVFLPSGVPHAVLHTDPGTSWLAVHLHADGPVTPGRPPPPAPGPR
jgi:cupin 2 domain-containing protein